MPKGNPQLEDGYTPIANELLEAVLRSDLSRQESKILFAIMRQTYGWHRKEAPISYRLFRTITRLDLRHIQRAINALLEKEIISRRSGAKLKYGKPVYNYQISKKHCCQYGNSTVANRETEAVANAATIKTRNIILKQRQQLVDKLSA